MARGCGEGGSDSGECVIGVWLLELVECMWRSEAGRDSVVKWVGSAGRRGEVS